MPLAAVCRDCPHGGSLFFSIGEGPRIMTRTMHVGLGLTATLLVCLLLAGCETGPALAPVEGTVTLDGNPVQGAEVEFEPTGEGGRPSVGITDANGHYELDYTMKEKGALLGEHIVRITTEGVGDEDEDEGGEESTRPTDEELDEGPRAGSTVPIPARYNVDSELKRTVEKGKNTFDFPLESGD